MKRGKKYVEAAKAVDRATLYDTAEAISLVKKAKQLQHHLMVLLLNTMV